MLPKSAVVLHDVTATAYRSYFVWQYNSRDNSAASLERHLLRLLTGVVRKFSHFNPSSSMMESNHNNRFVLCFDQGSSPRLQIDPDYKLHRRLNKTPEIELALQISAQWAADLESSDSARFLALPLKHHPKMNCEADDLIATAVRRVLAHREARPQVLMISHDHDLYKLIDTERGIFMYDSGKKSFVNEATVKKVYGVVPAMLTDLKCLTGDRGDGIKGIHGIGARTAAKLLNKYGSFELVMSEGAEKEAGELKRRIANSREAVRKSRELNTLRDEPQILPQLDKFLFQAKSRIGSVGVLGDVKKGGRKRMPKNVVDVVNEVDL